MHHYRVVFVSFFLHLILLLPLPTLQTNENDLLLHLLHNYSPFARPVLNASSAVVVTFGFELIHVVAVVESEQTIKQKVWLRMSWRNEFLTWKPQSWGGVTETRVDMNKVWTPDIFLQDDTSADMATGPEKYRSLVVMRYDGEHRWYIPTLLQSSCAFNVASFPCDDQKCRLVFTTWTHDQSEVDLILDQKPVVTKNYINSSEWTLVSVKRELRLKRYECCEHPFVDITYTVHLHRKPLYYVHSVIVPCIIQMVVILFTFFLPPESGERIGVVITVLLVFAVYLEVLSDTLPRTSTSTPALSRFYIAAMAESACSLLATCLVLIIHFKGTEKGVAPMPCWVREHLLVPLAHLLCVRRNIQPRATHQYSFNGTNGTNGTFGTIKQNGGGETKLIADGRGDVRDRENFSTGSLRLLFEEVRVITSLITDQNVQDEIEEEWQCLAKICDRLFFATFLFIFLVSSVVLLEPVYKG